MTLRRSKSNVGCLVRQERECSEPACGWALRSRLSSLGWYESHLAQAVIVPFVVIDSTRDPAFVGAKPWGADDFQQSTVGPKSLEVFAIGKIIDAGLDVPTVQRAREIG